jgi:hypothetical protein
MQEPGAPLANAAQSSHTHAKDGHGEPAQGDGHCDGDCDSPAGKSCPHALLRVKDGQIDEAHLYLDAATLMYQLGLLAQTPMPGQPISSGR